MARFTLPRDIYYGPGALDELKVLKGKKKAMIFTGGNSMRRGGFLQKTEEVLQKNGLLTQIYDGIEPDPSIETVFKGANALQEFEPDVIVAIGGGSPIDAAKAMWVFYEYPEKTFEDIKEPFTMPTLRQKAIFVAIPSTSGTASEVTAFSVITDYSTNIKYPLADFEITPDIAIIDYDIPQTMPQTLTAHTGMDALTHAIEAYTASARSDFSDPLALQAISGVFESLLDSFYGDVNARSKMHVAQCLAGMAFSNALLGIAHSLAHKIGAVFHIPHGNCNAILLPYVIQYNSKACLDRYAQIAKHLGLTGSTDKLLLNSLIDAINTLNTKLDIAHSMKEHGITEEDFQKHAQTIAHNAVLDPCTASNPRTIDDENMLKVLTCAYYGTPVTF
ncbi:MAG TPA: iron-containing alcohol dehydrogenase [Candidatus Avacidaminococcus intestinavium]|uniref:Iron-containing alcohol dehydrogenase n=1 Tax=Candidatus Avacidaminococcus intestinavium TaxID=2840684 RepID=A0A9D1MQ89_9FIRM|nr:iron-containing alcohol dehydrogenase [Candidatus Avacidaminococcus intestinavium]